jgi:hypothetical protein
MAGLLGARNGDGRAAAAKAVVEERLRTVRGSVSADAVQLRERLVEIEPGRVFDMRGRVKACVRGKSDCPDNG